MLPHIISPAAEGHFIFKKSRQQKKFIYISTNEERLEQTFVCAKFFAPQLRLVKFLPWDAIPYSKIAPTPSRITQRIKTLFAIRDAKADIIITTLSALLQKIPPLEEIPYLDLKVSEQINFEEIRDILTISGYQASSIVRSPGEFSVRGSVIDIFPADQENALRIDIFGNQLESIRLFNPESQRGIANSNISEVRILPVSELFLSPHNLTNFRTNCIYHFGHELAQVSPFLMPLLYANTKQLTSYADFPIVASSPVKIEEFFNSIKYYYRADSDNLSPEKLYSTSLPEIEYSQHNLEYQVPGPNPLQSSQTTIIACYTKRSLEKVRGQLPKRPHKEVENYSECIQGGINLCLLAINRGFLVEGIQIITEQEILGEGSYERPRKKAKSASTPPSFTEINLNDFVVHDSYGVGRFIGLNTLEILGVKHDCITLLYQNDDKLFIPIENANLISYFDSQEKEVPLDKLGSLGWQERKAKVKKRLLEIADELINLAAQRKLAKGKAFSNNDSLYQEFCSKFPYTETEDQIKAINEVEDDLNSGLIMDRLVCGDTGVGKTEVALRAAFLVVKEAGINQVAIITPTTVLCQQHFRLFIERFAGFPICIEQLSSLSKNNAKIKERIESGEIDIIIGTHALLHSSVKFANLSLVIIDEEHHFGVKQKEVLKKLKTNVHTLYLSATPLPRTLQMALIGIKDLSFITTLPEDRIPIKSSIIDPNPRFINEAIIKEYERGGATFYVCPFIKDLDEIAATLKLPTGLKMEIAHGKLPPSKLDQIITKFYNKECQLLLSTPIIESGIDIPHANTIIIHNAERFGVAQLYQLKGRVGRGKRSAYAYFVLSEHALENESALKRLHTITSLEGGYSVAAYDMDTRGFGNIIGEEQSGHVKEIGFELYQKMLNDAIAQHQNIEVAIEPEINVNIPVFIPENYVSDFDLRIDTYRRIAESKTLSDLENFSYELEDRFGAIPTEVHNLFIIIKTKILCRSLYIGKLDIGESGSAFTFSEGKYAPQVIAASKARKEKIKLLNEQKFIILSNEDLFSKIRIITGILTEANASRAQKLELRL